MIRTVLKSFLAWLNKPVIGSRLVKPTELPAALTTWLANGLAWLIAWLATRFVALSEMLTAARIVYRDALRTKVVRPSHYDPRSQVQAVFDPAKYHVWRGVE